jgi:nucleotide-binding universal stress UspA family protein
MTTVDLSAAPRLLVGFDGTPSGEDAVHLGTFLAEATGASLEIVHIARPTPAWRGLAAIAEAERVDVLVAGSSHRHGIGRVVFGSTVEALVHRGSSPVAVAPAGWRAPAGAALETIGVAVDGSPESRHALATATALARLTGARLEAIEAFRPRPPVHREYAGVTRSYRTLVAGRRDAVRRGLERATAGVPAEVGLRTAVLEGDPATALADRSGDLDLLVIGSRGRDPRWAFVAGSVSRAVLDRARCPVLVAPRGLTNADRSTA